VPVTQLLHQQEGAEQQLEEQRIVRAEVAVQLLQRLEEVVAPVFLDVRGQNVEQLQADPQADGQQRKGLRDWVALLWAQLVQRNFVFNYI